MHLRKCIRHFYYRMLIIIHRDPQRFKASKIILALKPLRTNTDIHYIGFVCFGCSDGSLDTGCLLLCLFFGKAQALYHTKAVFLNERLKSLQNPCHFTARTTGSTVDPPTATVSCRNSCERASLRSAKLSPDSGIVSCSAKKEKWMRAG